MRSGTYRRHRPALLPRHALPRQPQLCSSALLSFSLLIVLAVSTSPSVARALYSRVVVSTHPSPPNSQCSWLDCTDDPVRPFSSVVPHLLVVTPPVSVIVHGRSFPRHALRPLFVSVALPRRCWCLFFPFRTFTSYLSPSRALDVSQRGECVIFPTFEGFGSNEGAFAAVCKYFFGGACSPHVCPYASRSHG